MFLKKENYQLVANKLNNQYYFIEKKSYYKIN